MSEKQALAVVAPRRLGLGSAASGSAAGRASGCRHRSLAARFAADHRGTILMIFGLMVIPITGLVGASVDYGQALRGRARMQAALDSAVLAGGRVYQTTQSLSEAGAVATRHYERLKPDLSSGLVRTTGVEFKLDDARTTVIMTANGFVVTPFLNVLGIHGRNSRTGFDIGARSEATIKVGGEAELNIELSMMLDVTGSMGSGSKLADMKEAAKDLIDIIVWDDQSRYYSKVAIAPFSNRVNVGSFADEVTGKRATSSGKKLRTCVTERAGDDAFTDAAPGAGRWIGPYDPWDNSNNYSTSGSCTPSPVIMPLSSDKSALKSLINGFTASGTTAGHLGTAWAWYMLSPRWSGIFTGDSSPAAYNTPKLKKIAVLMTDGEYNAQYQSDNGNSAAQARALCANMKREGIEVYTVGFQLGGSQSAIDTLTQCATDESHFYNATDGERLRLAFRDIALKIASLRLAK